jgi:hypothetical protein
MMGGDSSPRSSGDVRASRPSPPLLSDIAAAKRKALAWRYGKFVYGRVQE